VVFEVPEGITNAGGRKARPDYSIVTLRARMEPSD
jgi:hypothetical protein